MPFREMKDVFQFKSYVVKLREALDASVDEPQDVWVVEKFVSDSQTCNMLLAGRVENKLVADIKAKGFKVYGPGQCMCDDKQIRLTGPAGITETLVREALRVARLNFTPVRVDALQTPAKGGEAAQKPGVTPPKTQPGPATAQVQAAAANAQKQAPALLERMDKVLARFLPGDKDKAAFEKLRGLLADAQKANNADRVTSLLGRLDDATKAAEARIQAMLDAKATFLAERDKLRAPFDAVSAIASTADAAALKTDWDTLDRLAAALAFTDANKSLGKVVTRVKAVRERTLKDRAAQIDAAVQDARDLLPNITPDEEKALATARAAWAALVEKAPRDAFAAAEAAFDQAVEVIAVPRRRQAEAETVLAKVRNLWEKVRYKVPDKLGPKVEGYYKAYKDNTPVNNIKNGRKLYGEIFDAYNATLDKQAQAQAQFQAEMQLRNQTDMENDAAVAYGDGRFTAGLVRAVWQQVKAVRSNNPPNGSIPGEHPLALVESAFATWRAPASGVLTNFHIPGNRPQAKWEKDFTRPQVQANFCVKWRGQKVNIHVDVEPRSFVAAYGDDLDWSQVPLEVQKALGRQ